MTAPLPDGYVLPTTGKPFVFWIDNWGHLRNGPVLRHEGGEVVVGWTRGQAITLAVSDLARVPRFWKPDAAAGAAEGNTPPSDEAKR